MAQYVYGKNVVKRLLEDKTKIYELYLSYNDDSIIKLAKSLNIKLIRQDRKQLDKLVGTDNHQGIIAKIDEYKTVEVSDILKKVPESEYGLIIVLDELEDPHNLGAILRSADAVGAHGVIIKKHNQVGLTPTVAQVSAGAINTVLVSSVTNISMTLKDLKDKGYWIVGTDMENAQDYRKLKYDMNIVVVIGNEGKGISPLVKKQCDFMVKLPMRGKISSLNASVATGILLYEIYNKRFPLGEWCVVFNAYELVYMIHQQDDYASMQFFNSYRLLVNKLVSDTINSYPYISFFKEDIQQESYVTLMETVFNYRDDQNANFKTFIYVCVTRKIKSMIRHYLCQKNVSNLNAVSLDDTVCESGGVYAIELTENQNKLNEPKYTFEFNEAIHRFNAAYDRLSEKDKLILNLTINRVSYDKASKLLECSKKKYDNMVQKVKRNIKEAILYVED